MAGTDFRPLSDYKSVSKPGVSPFTSASRNQKLVIDFTSMVTGAGFTAVVGWLASFLALRKDERSVQITQITEERTKWRAAIRELTQNIVIAFSGESEHSNEEKARLRAALATSLNPKCESDNQILSEFGNLKHGSDTTRFTLAISLLLKHDWERVKWECIPIYIKPFNLLKKKNRAWRSKDFRALPKANQ